MKISMQAALVAATLALPSAALAQVLSLAPADPQPKAGSLQAGLAVQYAYPGDVRTVRDAKRALNNRTEQGPPLRGLSYDDTSEGDPTLTAKKPMKVAAAISGYIKFDAAGTYTLDFLNNDGLELMIGGQLVADYDEVHSCGYAGELEVEVPKAGYYALEATYFQRKGTACLMMEWGPDSDGLEQTPDSAFFH
ncbi:PA14 domain-containing protein [uncultured Roseobacter sp.]|uniref:PA14 domain-containing protein n=1 Tax=uncultured Roseobacter sp. TaxID=114847 RepID=UPI0026249C23|nr:PA14 domain-containing protein [uncultured Roseobacter sp.]